MLTVLTVRLGIAHLDLQEALRDAVHLLDLGSPRQGGCALQSIVEQLTVCSRPPRRGSSNTLLRAKGDTVVVIVDGGGKVFVPGAIGASGGVTRRDDKFLTPV